MKHVLAVVKGPEGPLFVREYASPHDRTRAIPQLRRRGYNYFVCYKEASGGYALMFATCEWVAKELGERGAYIDR